MRRVNPAYLIATSVRVKLDKVGHILRQNNDKINDKLFEKEKKSNAFAAKVLTAEEQKARKEKGKGLREKAGKKEGDEGKAKKATKAKVIFTQPRTEDRFKSTAKRTDRTLKKKKALSETAKQRKALQKAIDSALTKEVKKVPQLKDYLQARFQLHNGEYPHAMKF